MFMMRGEGRVGVDRMKKLGTAKKRERVIERERERERERENNSKPDTAMAGLMCIIQFIPHDNMGNQMITDQASEA